MAMENAKTIAAQFRVSDRKALEYLKAQTGLRSTSELLRMLVREEAVRRGYEPTPESPAESGPGVALEDAS